MTIDLGPLQSGPGLDIGTQQSAATAVGVGIDLGPLQSLDIGPLQSAAAAAPVLLAGEADGVGGAQATLAATAAALYAECDGIGQAQAALAASTVDRLDLGPLQSGSGLDIGPLQSAAGGGGGTAILLACEADAAGNAQARLVVGASLRCEADGAGAAQSDIVGPALRLTGEADGTGAARSFLGGGTVSITCIVSTGVTVGSPPAPQSTVLYDIPSAW